MRNPYFTNIVKKRRNVRKVIRSEVFVVILTMIIIFFSVLFLFSSYQLKIFAENIPKESEIISRVSQKTENSKVFDRNGVLLYEFKDPNQDREYIELENVPTNLIWILLSAEDINFYRHEGVDVKGLVRSLNIFFNSSGEIVVGGSTITQQLVKNTVLTNEKTLERKAKEMFIALLIENRYSKADILEMYLNSISFGGNIIGIKTASRTYFSKELSELTFEESVFLVSLIQLPGKTSPLFSTNEQLAWDLVELRKKYIYEQIFGNYKYIAENNNNFPGIEELFISEENSIKLKPNIGAIKAPHFVFYIKDLLLKSPFNLTEEELGNGGYSIYTTLDYKLQQIAEAKIKEGIDKFGRLGFANASLVTLDPENSNILAMVGSKDYFGVKNADGSFDPYVNVTLSERNLGSSLKPFIAYEAFKQRKFKSDSVIKDEPVDFDDYKPKNYDGKFQGDMTVKEALVKSRNIPFVKITKTVGVESVLAVLESLGYKNATHKDKYGLSIALGGFSSNLLEHTHAYSVFPNKGTLAAINPISKLENQDSKVIYKSEVTVEKTLDKRYIQEVDKILEEYGLPGISGKTGTTDSNADNYFIGYNQKFLTGLWIGNNNNKPMSRNAFGSTTALPIWNLYYAEVIKQFPEYAANSVKKSVKPPTQ